MVSSVSSNYGYVPVGLRASSAVIINNQNDVENLVRYLNGQPIQQMADPTIMQSATGSLPFIAIFGGIQGIGALKNNGWKLGETIRNVNASIPYTTRSQALTAGKDTIVKEFKNIFTKSATTAAPTGRIGKLMTRIPGYTKLKNSGFGQAMGKSGAGWMMAIEGGIEMFTNVVPTFKTLGAGSGFKQLGKSTVKVASSAVGWIGGSAIGKGIGAAIGTFICPGIGTAIGSFIGSFIGGCVGSAATGKLAKKITGPSELEKYNNQQIQAIAQQADADPATKVAMAQQALQTAEQTLAQDPQNAEALAAKASAEAILSEVQATQTQEVQQGNPQQVATQPQMMPQCAVNQFGVPIVPGFNPIGFDIAQFNAARQQSAMVGIINPFQTQSPYAYQNPFVHQTTQ